MADTDAIVITELAGQYRIGDSRPSYRVLATYWEGHLTGPWEARIERRGAAGVDDRPSIAQDPSAYGGSAAICTIPNGASDGYCICVLQDKQTELLIPAAGATVVWSVEAWGYGWKTGADGYLEEDLDHPVVPSSYVPDVLEGLSQDTVPVHVLQVFCGTLPDDRSIYYRVRATVNGVEVPIEDWGWASVRRPD